MREMFAGKASAEAVARQCVAIEADGVDGPWDYAVAIPARNEQRRITRCLQALEAAAARAPSRRGGVVLHINGTSDLTAETALAWLQTRRVPYILFCTGNTDDDANAGKARRLAMDAACSQVHMAGGILTTDADTYVDGDWIDATMRAFYRGVELVCGHIELSNGYPLAFSREGLHVAALEQTLFDRLRKLRHRILGANLDPVEVAFTKSFGGASLAVAADTYRRIGGIPAIPCGEDRAFVTAAIDLGCRVEFSKEVLVKTSGRTVGRAVGGLATMLHSLSSQGDGPSGARTVDEALEPVTDLIRRWQHRYDLHQCWIGRDSPESLIRRGPRSFRGKPRWLEAATFDDSWKAYRDQALPERRRLREVELQRELDIAQAWLTAFHDVRMAA